MRTEDLLNYQPSSDNEPIIVQAYRTPIARAFSVFVQLSTIDLLCPLITQITEHLDDKSLIDEVIIGNAIGFGGNIARLASLTAGLPISVPGVTVDRQCGSGLETIIQAARNIQSGAGQCYIAGGVESVSTAPWKMERPINKKALPVIAHRSRFSPDSLGDPDVGTAAESVAKKCNISRHRQDAFALRSHQRAIQSIENGDFTHEIIPIHHNNNIVDTDECPRANTSLDILASLKPAFANGGSVTAGNSCPVNDGASIVLIMSRAMAKRCGYRTGMRFLDATSAGVDPNYLGLGPVASTQKLLQRQPQFTLAMADYIEFNEAFASQVLGSLDELGIDEHRVNRGGGALAIGHPYGASGAIMVTRLFSQLISNSDSFSHKHALAMLGIAGGLGLTSLFDTVKI